MKLEELNTKTRKELDAIAKEQNVDSKEFKLKDELAEAIAKSFLPKNLKYVGPEDRPPSRAINIPFGSIELPPEEEQRAGFYCEDWLRVIAETRDILDAPLYKPITPKG